MLPLGTTLKHFDANIVNVISIESSCSVVVSQSSQYESRVLLFSVVLAFHAWLQFLQALVKQRHCYISNKSRAAMCDSPFIQRDYRSFVCVWRIYKLQFLVRETAGSTLADTKALGSIRYCCRSSGTAYQPAALPLVPAIRPWFEFGSATFEPHIHPCQSSCTINARIMPLSNVQGK